MDRVRQVLEQQAYQQKYKALQQHEMERTYCRHDMEHFYRVAQIAIMVAKENNLSFSEEEIRLAALFHDMGRVMQYENKISHAKASAVFAEEILSSLAYDPQKISEICEAIEEHSNRQNAKKGYVERRKLSTLGELLSFADQFSRECYCCPAKAGCKWKEEELIEQAYFTI